MSLVVSSWKSNPANAAHDRLVVLSTATADANAVFTVSSSCRDFGFTSL